MRLVVRCIRADTVAVAGWSINSAADEFAVFTDEALVALAHVLVVLSHTGAVVVTEFLVFNAEFVAFTIFAHESGFTFARDIGAIQCTVIPTIGINQSQHGVQRTNHLIARRFGIQNYPTIALFVHRKVGEEDQLGGGGVARLGGEQK
jgi:hypothetical protein